MKVEIPFTTAPSADVEGALDRLLFALLVDAVKYSVETPRTARRDVSSTGTDRDQDQTSDAMHVRVVRGDGEPVGSQKTAPTTKRSAYHQPRPPCPKPCSE